MDTLAQSKQYVKQKIEAPYLQHHDGFLIREARLHLGATLSQIAENLCAVSYLSRIEAGESKPNPDLLNQLFQKLDIEGPRPTVKSQWTYPFRVALYQHNLTLLKQISQTVPLNYQKSLLQFALGVLENDEELVKQKRKILSRLEPYLMLEELQVYYLFLSIHYHHCCLSSKSIHYAQLALKITKHLDLNDPYLLLHMARYHFKAGQTVQGFFQLQQALNQFSEMHSTKYIIECELLLCEEYIKQHSIKLAQPILTRLKNTLNYHDPFSQHPSLLAVIALLYQKQKNFALAEENYRKSLSAVESEHHTNFQQTLVALLELYYQTNEHNKLKKLLGQIKTYPFNSSTQSKVKYYHHLVNEPYTDILRIFLKKEAFPLACQENDSLYVSLYARSLIDYYEHHGKYKAALKVYHQLDDYQLTFEN